MSQIIDDTRDAVQAGRDAASRHLWNEAYELLARADREGGLSGPDLEALAESAWWTAHPDEAIAYRERAYEAYISHDRSGAARVALGLAREYVGRTQEALARAWLRQGERLLDGEPESIEHGYLHFTQWLAHAGGADDALEHARAIQGIAARFQDADLQAYGVQLQGMMLVKQGKVEEGLALIDEATVAAVSGELSPMATGLIYCMTISISRELADYRRAGEWTEAAKRWCERKSINGFPGVCRVHRAEIMALRGAWTEAEEEARRAAEELSRFNFQFIAADGFYEIGEIRLRMGDLPAAEEAFQQAHESGRVPQPGTALLRLAEGNIEAAAASIRRTLEEDVWDRLGRARLLPVQVDIALAAGDVATARAGAEELESIAGDFGSPALRACAACARGAVLLAEGDPSAARRFLRQACRLWQEVEVPYELARSRLRLAEACVADGDLETARMEVQAARTKFQQLGAVLDLRRAAQTLERLQQRPAGSVERATKTFMFTDIEKSTALVEALGDEAWQDLLRLHDRTLRALFAEYGGEEINSTGDGFFVAFDDAERALDAAAAIQRKLLEQRRTGGFPIRVRIGLHRAEATKRGADYGGRGVHLAARVAALAGGGQIVASDATVGDGPWRERASAPRDEMLKGIQEPVRVVSIAWA